MFPKLDPKLYPIADDEQLVLDLLKQQRVLVVQGSAFNLEDTQHLRIVFLPDQALLEESISRLANFLAKIRSLKNLNYSKGSDFMEENQENKKYPAHFNGAAIIDKNNREIPITENDKRYSGASR